MSAPLAGATGDQIPPPPYHQYLMDRTALLGRPGLYENVSPGSPGPSGQPPSPTEQVPIAFSEHPVFPRANTGPCFYLPYNQQLKDNSPTLGYARPMFMAPPPDPRRTATGSRSHVYDEIIVPQEHVEVTRSERPPVPPRPSRTPSRSPPAIPTSISEEGG